MQSNIYNFLYNNYSEIKFWSFILGGVWAAFKYGRRVVDWFTEIKTNHLHHIELNMAELKVGLEEQNKALKENTEAIVGELKLLRSELRDDIRSMTTALLTRR